MRRDEEYVVMRTWKMEVGGHRKMERPKPRWRDVIRRHEGERSTERRSTRPENMVNENSMRRPQIRKTLNGKCCHLPATPSSGSRVISGAAWSGRRCAVALSTRFNRTILVSKKTRPLAALNSAATLWLHEELNVGRRSTTGRKNVSRVEFSDWRSANLNRMLSMGAPTKFRTYRHLLLELNTPDE